jgi:hypothetical protein
VIFDVGDHLDPRQVARQGATIGLALGGARFPLGRRLDLLVGFLGGRGLLGVLKAQQQLILGKRLGPSTQPVTLTSLMIWASRLARVRSASRIAFNVAGSWGENRSDPT